MIPYSKHDDPCAVVFGVRDEFAADVVHRPQITGDRRVVRPNALQAVIQMRQIDQRKRRLARFADMDRGSRDPFAGGDRGRRPPKGEQGKGTQELRQFVPQLRRRRIAVRQLAAVRAIDRAPCDANVSARIHVVPPEHVGAGKSRVARSRRVPKLFVADERRRLAPEPDLRQVAEIPAVADDPVLVRQDAGQKCSLSRAGDGRRDVPRTRIPPRATAADLGCSALPRVPGRPH